MSSPSPSHTYRNQLAGQLGNRPPSLSLVENRILPALGLASASEPPPEHGLAKAATPSTRLLPSPRLRSWSATSRGVGLSGYLSLSLRSAVSGILLETELEQRIAALIAL